MNAGVVAMLTATTEQRGDEAPPVLRSRRLLQTRQATERVASDCERRMEDLRRELEKLQSQWSALRRGDARRQELEQRLEENAEREAQLEQKRQHRERLVSQGEALRNQAAKQMPALGINLDRRIQLDELLSQNTALREELEETPPGREPLGETGADDSGAVEGEAGASADEGDGASTGALARAMLENDRLRETIVASREENERLWEQMKRQQKELDKLLSKRGTRLRTREEQEQKGYIDEFTSEARARLASAWETHPGLQADGDAPFRSLTDDTFTYKYEDVSGAISANPKRGWIYHLVLVETGTGRVLSLSKIGNTKAGNLHNRLHAAKSMSAYSNPYVHWELVDLRPVDDKDRAELLVHRALDWRGIRLGRHKKHASEQFFLNDELREYTAMLFAATRWTAKPWLEQCVGKKSGANNSMPEIVVRRYGRWKDDPGVHLVVPPTPARSQMHVRFYECSGVEEMRYADGSPVERHTA